MNEHVLKHFTGGETLHAEIKYGRTFAIRPCGKIWLSVNHRPRVADDSFGFWRRIRLIPFRRTFAGTGDDRTLRDRLRGEAPGILRWAVDGCLAWQKAGLVTPDAVSAATEEYKDNEDPLAEFFAACVVCDEATRNSVTAFSKIYKTYKAWADDQGIAEKDRLTAKSFGSLMQKRGFEVSKPKNIVSYTGFLVVETRLFE